MGAPASIFQFGLHPDIWPDIHYVAKRKLLSTTMATLYRRVGLAAGNYPALIMDVQGAELLVLKGAADLLDSFTFIKAEAADFEIYVGCAKLSDLQEFLLPRGFVELFVPRSQRAMVEELAGTSCGSGRMP